MTRFHLTPHAARRAAERGVSVEEMKAVVRDADQKTRQYAGEHGGTVFRFSKAGSGATLTVIAEIKKHECWLVTGYYESI